MLQVEKAIPNNGLVFKFQFMKCKIVETHSDQVKYLTKL